MLILSDATKTAVLRALSISSVAQVFERTFLDITPDHDADRKMVLGLYADRNRGSVRLNAGHFYTASEKLERINRVKQLQLP